MLLFAAAAQSSVFAQSIDLNAPTPVISNEISGRILPLDVGDSRATRFFYTFNGLQGDLELTVESNNLDGDIDIFLANNLRPLTKVTLYAGGGASRAAKTIYLRREEPLILRVQARTPNDAEGTYRIRLGGAFKPATRLASDPAAAPVDETAATNSAPARSADRKVRRVSSVGARIEEPVTEVAREESEKTADAPEPPPVTPKRAPTTARPARTRTPPRRAPRTDAARRNSPKADTSDAAKNDTSKPETDTNETANAEARAASDAAEKAAAPKPERARPVRVPRARNNRNTTTARRTGAAPPADAVAVPSTPAETSATPPEAPGTRLVLVMRDGETFVRNMSSVRRVTVERGMLLIVSKNGTVERQPMSSVLRMSIEP